MAMHQDNLTAALALASAGIKIFPAGTDKRPLVKGWQDAATCNADQINSWWESDIAIDRDAKAPSGSSSTEKARGRHEQCAQANSKRVRRT